ncbi:DUF1761 domain-containing protein [Flavobacterium sp. ANB]|jgi:hypothetical protein|uniref:DUF1761 domain-containing protein n=1 Tax=unclassified Flavobacterium TaxID=196869 RepID=UPI0012B789CA|nr:MULTISPECIES: DUF1761 domain-containing protein [unclassified Flavobacterium]MBF4515933.1 DUF1761 domain-containing protein [Flavobacterium sp. ANB]MTD68935.1 DUF1761 family protein [Flavobacterium sp. LC2016-13]
MINQLPNLNWISVLLAFVAYFLLGALWFTLFFSKSYKKSLGRENEILENKLIFIVGPALCSLVITIASAVLVYALNISSLKDGFEFSAFIGIGFLVANTVNIAINPNIPKPIFYGIISGSYHLVGILIVNTIIIAMK